MQSNNCEFHTFLRLARESYGCSTFVDQWATNSDLRIEFRIENWVYVMSLTFSYPYSQFRVCDCWEWSIESDDMEMPNESNRIATKNDDLIGMTITHVPTQQEWSNAVKVLLWHTYGDAPKSHHPPYRFPFHFHFLFPIIFIHISPITLFHFNN